MNETRQITKALVNRAYFIPTKKFFKIFRSDVNSLLKHSEMKTVTFGTACAPLLAIRCIKQLAVEHKEAFSKASAVMEDSFYVDDLLNLNLNFIFTIRYFCLHFVFKKVNSILMINCA